MNLFTRKYLDALSHCLFLCLHHLFRRHGALFFYLVTIVNGSAFASADVVLDKDHAFANSYTVKLGDRHLECNAVNAEDLRDYLEGRSARKHVDRKFPRRCDRTATWVVIDFDCLQFPTAGCSRSKLIRILSENDSRLKWFLTESRVFTTEEQLGFRGWMYSFVASLILEEDDLEPEPVLSAGESSSVLTLSDSSDIDDEEEGSDDGELVDDLEAQDGIGEVTDGIEVITRTSYGYRTRLFTEKPIFIGASGQYYVLSPHTFRIKPHMALLAEDFGHYMLIKSRTKRGDRPKRQSHRGKARKERVRHKKDPSKYDKDY